MAAAEEPGIQEVFDRQDCQVNFFFLVRICLNSCRTIGLYRLIKFAFIKNPDALRVIGHLSPTEYFNCRNGKITGLVTHRQVFKAVFKSAVRRFNDAQTIQEDLNGTI